MVARQLAWVIARMPGAVNRGIAISFGDKQATVMRGGEYRDLLPTVPGYDEEFD